MSAKTTWRATFRISSMHCNTSNHSIWATMALVVRFPDLLEISLISVRSKDKNCVLRARHCSFLILTFHPSFDVRNRRPESQPTFGWTALGVRCHDQTGILSIRTQPIAGKCSDWLLPSQSGLFPPKEAARIDGRLLPQTDLRLLRRVLLSVCLIVCWLIKESMKYKSTICYLLQNFDSSVDFFGWSGNVRILYPRASDKTFA